MERLPMTIHSRSEHLSAGVAHRLSSLHLVDDSTQIVRLRSLQRWEFYVGFEVFQPQLLTDREHVPVVLKRGHPGGKCATDAHCALLVNADRLLELNLDFGSSKSEFRKKRTNPVIT